MTDKISGELDKDDKRMNEKRSKRGDFRMSVYIS